MIIKVVLFFLSIKKADAKLIGYNDSFNFRSSYHICLLDRADTFRFNYVANTFVKRFNAIPELQSLCYIYITFQEQPQSNVIYGLYYNYKLHAVFLIPFSLFLKEATIKLFLHNFFYMQTSYPISSINHNLRLNNRKYTHKTTICIKQIIKIEKNKN